MPDKKKPGFTRDLRVGFKDRGLDHGDFGILRGDGQLIAELESTAQDPDGGIEVLPVEDNVLLFTAAPDLYDACVSAIHILMEKGYREDTLIGRLEAAVQKVFPEYTYPYIIDCDVAPHIPVGLELRPEAPLSSAVRGRLHWDPTKVALYLSERQTSNGRWVKGHILYEELKGQKILSANVLDYLLAYPRLIPETWKGKLVFFWGTIYSCTSSDRLSVRYLYGGVDGWGGYFAEIGDDWDRDYPAAVLIG